MLLNTIKGLVKYC